MPSENHLGWSAGINSVTIDEFVAKKRRFFFDSSYFAMRIVAVVGHVGPQVVVVERSQAGQVAVQYYYYNYY